MIGGIAQNKVWAVDAYLDAILGLNYPRNLISLVWLVNDSTDGTKERFIERLRDVKAGGEYRRVSITEINYAYTDVRNDRSDAEHRIYQTMDPNKDVTNFAHFARVRNDWLKLRTHNLSIENGKVVVGDELPEDVGHEQFYFSIDSDVVLKDATTLVCLVRHGVDAVAIPVDNAENRKDKYDPQREAKAKLVVDPLAKNVSLISKIESGAIKGVRIGSPHVWNFGILRNGILSRFEPRSFLFEVDATGACILFNSEMVEAGVKYGPYPTGEDWYFCALAKSYGYKLFVDGSFRTCHMMDYNPLKEEVKV